MKKFGLTIMLSAVGLLEASAQNLRPPSREVFRCEDNGKVVYSDAPCLGARRVDVEPTRGMNKTSGAERIGADVRKERHNESMAKALHPLFGEAAEQRATRHRRAKLSTTSQSVCSRLDAEIPAAEVAERGNVGDELRATQVRLLKLRKEYKALGC